MEYLRFVSVQPTHNIIVIGQYCLNDKRANPPIFFERDFRCLTICFRLQDKTVILCFKWSRFGLSVIVVLVLQIGLHYVLFSLINEDLCPLLYFVGKFGSWYEIFIGIISQFVIQDVEGNSAMKNFTRLASNTGVISSVIVEYC